MSIRKKKKKEEEANQEQVPEEDTNYIVSRKHLLSLFEKCATCHAPSPGEITKVQGTWIEIKQVLTDTNDLILRFFIDQYNEIVSF